MLGGALGNLIDRVRLGYVVDFVHVYWRQHQWPDFNVADSAITIGVALLVLDILRSPGQRRRARGTASSRRRGPPGGSSDMHPRLLTIPAFELFGRRLGPFTLHTYGVLLAIAFLAGLWVVSRQAKRAGLDAGRITDMAVWVLIAGLRRREAAAGRRGLALLPAQPAGAAVHLPERRRLLRRPDRRRPRGLAVRAPPPAARLARPPTCWRRA